VIGQYIQQIRQANNLSQEALGNPQFSAAYVSRIENGLQEPSRRFLSHIAIRLPYRTEQFYQPGFDGHVIDILMHLARILHDMGNRNMAWDLAARAVDVAKRSGDPLIMCWAAGFQLTLTSDPELLVAMKRFWQMVQIVDWDRASTEATVRFVKVLAQLPSNRPGEGHSSISPMRPRARALMLNGRSK